LRHLREGGEAMAKADLKTKETDDSVEEFLNSVADEGRRADAFAVLEIFRRATGEEPRMWGPAIVGFGHRVMKYESGREFDWMHVAFSPRKANLTLYVFSGSPKQDELLAKLGKFKSSKACLYIKRLSDVDEKVLESLVRDSVEYSKKNNP
jgi:hypothetical protein